MTSDEDVPRDEELARLRKEWAGSWDIWRARRYDDPPGSRTGEFVATRLDDGVGDRTVMQPTAGELDEALRGQREMPAHGFGL